MSNPKHVQVCLLTYRRPELLRLTLNSLLRQSAAADPEIVMHILVVDNHDEQSGRPVFDEILGSSPVAARYVPEPARGLSAARNRALNESAGMDFVAFLDDDEVADPEWLSTLFRAAVDFRADVVTGPVWPQYIDSPEWVVRGGFFAAQERPTGSDVEFVATNNVLLHADVASTFRFDSRFDATGGEDTEFFMRIRHTGHRIVWVNEAVVSESIPGSRANVRWLLSRARSDANRYTRSCLSIDSGAGTVRRRLIVAGGGFLKGVSLLPLGLLGREHAVRGLQFISRSAGTLSALRGRNQIYYEPASATSVAGSGPQRLPHDAEASDADAGGVQRAHSTDKTAPQSSASAPITVVVVGQVPPPMNGQALMISEFLAGTYPGLRIDHVPMVFSRTTAEIGSFGVRKLGLLLTVLIGIWRGRIRGAMRGEKTILYYPPAGANMVPVLRDLFLLTLTRWLFRRTVFHFHAAGLYGIYPRLPAVFRPLFHIAYDRPDLAIFTTRSTSAEAGLLKARSSAIIPCGIRDVAVGYNSEATEPPTILFAGILCEGKGILTLIEACRGLRAAGVSFRLVCMGAFQGVEFQSQVEEMVRDAGLQDQVSFPGVLTGSEKAEAFASASIFCFPSHYPAESFGVVLIEAMSFSLPIVATDWQGIPEVTGTSGGTYLVPIKQPIALAESLQKLLLSPDLRRTMGEWNRDRYLGSFTLDIYRQSLHRSLLDVAGPRTAGYSLQRTSEDASV